MNMLGWEDLVPGRTVWLEDSGMAFKELTLSCVRILFRGTREAVYFRPETGEVLRMDRYYFRQPMCWRCWYQKPDPDMLCECPWVTEAEFWPEYTA